MGSRRLHEGLEGSGHPLQGLHQIHMVARLDQLGRRLILGSQIHT